MRRALFIAVIALFAAAVSVWAGVGASVSGTVLDAQSFLVPNATVTLLNTATNVQQSVVTDDNGVYSFRALAVGTYELQVESAGFRPYRRVNIVVDANADSVRYALSTPEAVDQIPLCSRESVSVMPTSRSCAR